MTILGDLLCDVMSRMPMLPPGVGREVQDRLPDIVEALESGILDDAAIVLSFDDLGHEAVVLTVTIKIHFAHVDVSTNAEAIVVSNGYDLMVHDTHGGIHVDTDLPSTLVDHGRRLGRHIATEAATAHVEAARALMRTHPAFRDMEE